MTNLIKTGEILGERYEDPKKSDAILSIDPKAQKLLEQWGAIIANDKVFLNPEGEFNKFNIADIGLNPANREESPYDLVSVRVGGENIIEVSRRYKDSGKIEKERYKLKEAVVERIE